MLSGKVGLLGHYQNDIHMNEIEKKNYRKWFLIISQRPLKVIKKFSKAGDNCQLMIFQMDISQT